MTKYHLNQEEELVQSLVLNFWTDSLQYTVVSSLPILPCGLLACNRHRLYYCKMIWVSQIDMSAVKTNINLHRNLQLQIRRQTRHHHHYPCRARAYLVGTHHEVHPLVLIEQTTLYYYL